MDPHATTTTTSFYYPLAVPPLELPASQQTRFPTLQRAGAFLKQAQSSLPYDAHAAPTAGELRHPQQPLGGGAASPTSPSAVAVAASFLASIRLGLDDLAHDSEEDDDEDDDEDDSPRYYAGGSGNTYYAPPPSLFQLPTPPPVAVNRRRDDDLIFDMEM